MSLLDQLNARQLEAVQCVDHHLRIIAGAGSGKTRVVTTRIAYLIDELHVFPNKVLAITFTNKAAKEMKERVESILKDVSRAVQISTIHSFCVRLLREDILELGYPRNFTILDSDDQKSILKDAYKQMHIDVKSYSYSSVIAYISANKTNFVDPDMALANAGVWAGEKVKAEVYAFYQKRLSDMYALDFDDLLIFAHRILKNKDEIRKKWQKRFTYIHVDEFQDVDQLQYEIIKMLVKEDSYLCVVGDPDQTIYTWRGAQVDIIMNFERDFPDSQTVVLNQNYRSTQQILNGANALIKNNKHRIDKELFTEIQSDARIVHFTALDGDNEPVWVAGKIKTLYHAGIDYHDIAILYRSNYLSRGLEKALLDAHIPYRIYGGIRFYDRAEIKDALSYLRLLAPCLEDEKALYKNLAVKRVINSPKRGIGAKTLETIEVQAEHDDINMYDVLKCYDLGKGKAKASIEEFVRVIELCKSFIEEISIDQLLEKVLEESGYLSMLQEDKEIERLENIKELINDIADYVERNPDGTLQDYLQEISLYTDKEDQGQTSAFVQLMTIHAAKGLEFDNVFVYSLCEGIFPNEKSVMEGGNASLEEERRLAYVAFTRARKQLFLSDSYGYSYILDKVKTTSRFIAEIPEEYMEDVSVKPKNSFSQDRMSGMDFFSFQRNQRSEQEEHVQYAPQEMHKIATNEVEKPKKKGKIRKGDLVNHNSFGDGVVIKLEGDLAVIAFDQKFGIRKIAITHPALTKK